MSCLYDSQVPDDDQASSACTPCVDPTLLVLHMIQRLSLRIFSSRLANQIYPQANHRPSEMDDQALEYMARRPLSS